MQVLYNLISKKSISSIIQVYPTQHRQYQLGFSLRSISNYPPRALREVLINAVSHSVYYLRDQETRVLVQQFPDKIVVSNQCYRGSNFKGFMQRSTRLVNKSLVSILRRLDHVESLGSGMTAIARSSITDGRPLPVIEVEDNDPNYSFWKVTLTNGPSPDFGRRALASLLRVIWGNREKDEETLAVLLIGCEGKTIKEVRSILGPEEKFHLTLNKETKYPGYFEKDVFVFREWAKTVINLGREGYIPTTLTSEGWELNQWAKNVVEGKEPGDVSFEDLMIVGWHVPQKIDNEREQVAILAQETETPSKKQEGINLQRLQSKPQELDSTRLEQYLSEEEFKKVFNMSSGEFEKLSLWKINQLKKKVGLW